MVNGRPTPHAPIRASEETPFIATVGGFDSPQRPGKDHSPGVEHQAFTGTGGGQWEQVMILDDGSEVKIPTPFVVDHQARTVRWPDPLRGIISRYSSSSLILPDRLLSGPNGTMYYKEYQKNGVPYGTEYGTAVTTRQLLTQPYDSAVPPTWTQSVTAGSVAGKLLKLKDFFSHSGYVAEGGTLYATYDSNAGEKRYAVTPPGSYPYGNGRSKYLVEHTRHAPQAPPNTPSWQSPDGRVSVTAGWRDDHALLEGPDGQHVTLSAYDHTFTGGSWAACCGPVVEGESKTSAPEPWVLHELGGTVTRVTPDGQAVSISREVFEAEILRVSAGTFRRFSALGTLFNTWPPQWAYAECGADKLVEVRAVGLHDPWRDSVRGSPPKDALPPHPAWWYWPARPRTRPKTLPKGAPAAPLRLALTDVYAVTETDDGGGPA